MRTYCTYFDRNYLVKALALIESLNRHEKQPFRLLAVCLDELTELMLRQLALPNVVPIPLAEIELGDAALLNARNNRTLVEYYWTLTPTVILRLLQGEDEGDSITYIDADLFFYSPPDPIFEEFAGHSVLIHGHRFSPAQMHLEIHGKYNVGLLCFRNDAEGLEVLNWWRERCNEWCYSRVEDGKFGDQLYLDDWPERFRGVHVLEHPGAGVAPWNHDQYEFGVAGDGTPLIDGLPVIFYHFHALAFVSPDIVVPAKHFNYPLPEQMLRLCLVPYLHSLMKAIDLARGLLPDFSFGLQETPPLTNDHTIVAQSDMAEQLRAAGLTNPSFSLGGEWDCYASQQLIPDRTEGVQGVPECAGGRSIVFPESRLAHQWLDGLQGVEIGPSTHNPFGLNTRNVGIKDEIYEKEQVALVGKAAQLDIIARADEIPLPDESEDFILSSHVLEHCPNLIKTLVEWYRIVKRDGFIFMIIPHRYAAPSDRDRSLTGWAHILADFRSNATELTEPEAGMFGHCHYHVFSPETMKDFVDRIFGNRLKLVDSQDIDDKLGNGFTLVYRKENSESLPWEYVPHDNNADRHFSEAIRVSAIVSTYNSETFIRGCLEDLVEQTLFKKGMLEVIVVDSASPQEEGRIVKEFQFRYANISYIRTDQRETIYQAWNRGIKAARGKYVTNANTDDRHRSDALEVLASALDDNPQVALVYGDVFVTNLPNQTFNEHIRCGYHLRPDFTPEIMLSGCHMGPQPMWRKSVHEHIGWFHEDLRSAGDYEFWCRIALHAQLLHIPDFLGLYFENPRGFCNADMGLSAQETMLVKRSYGEKLPAPQRCYTNNLQYGGPAEQGRFVNIGMITYNRLEFTRLAIDALIIHTDFPYVLTVIDNASTDGTREYLQEQKRRGIIKNLVLLDENVGVAKASNLAWSLEPESGCYLKLDNDIVIQKPGWLGSMVDAAEALDKAGAVAYNFEPVSYPLTMLGGRRVRPKLEGNLGGACILIPRRTHDLLGYWCEDYGLYGEEDADYGYRIHLAGLLNIYMEDEEIGFHLPAGRAASIDESYSARDGAEESMYADYRDWKDNLRRINVLGGLFGQNLKAYRSGEKSIRIGSKFVEERPGNDTHDGSSRVEARPGVVTVVIPVFNQALLTRNCLRKLLGTTTSGLEIVVVDNASTDWTPEYLATLGDGVRVITNQANLGFAAACNQGAAIATGELLLFLNNDTLPQPGWLEALLAGISEDRADIVGARLLYPDGTVQHAGIAIGEDLIPYHIFARFPADSTPVMEKRTMQAVTGACMLIRRALFNDLHGFDEGYRNGFEDVDLCLRAAALGSRIIYQPASVVIHHAEQSSGRKEHDIPNMERFLSRWRGRLHQDDQALYARFGLRCQRGEDGRFRVSPMEGQAPAVSIIIPLFNQVELTAACLAALKRNSPPTMYELVLVDNGSTDETALLLNDWTGKATILRNERNHGFAAACNQGARAARGETLLFLNNDTEPTPGWMVPLMEALAEPGVGIAGSKLLFPDGTIQHAGIEFMDDPLTGNRLSPCHVGYRHPDGPEYRVPRDFPAVTAASMAVPRRLFLQAGGFCEEYWNGFEDVDLCCRIREMGYTIRCCPESVVIHHESKSGPERTVRQAENLSLLQQRWGGRIQAAYRRVSEERVVPI